MTHHDNLAAVRAACIAANPEIRREKFNSLNNAIGPDFGKFPDGPHYVYREITLPDVLLALQEKYPLRKKDMFDYDLDAYESELLCLLSRKGPVAWNSRLPLSGQSEETISYLAALLKNE